MRRLARPLLILLAIVFLIEAWLWSHLEPIVASIVARIPLRAMKTRIAGAIRKLPPAATLVVFAVPLAALFPLKLLGFWLLAQQQWLAAGVVLVLAKLVGVAVTAFVFEMTRPKLLQLAWFRWLYQHVLVWLAWAHRLVAPTRRRVRKRGRHFDHLSREERHKLRIRAKTLRYAADVFEGLFAKRAGRARRFLAVTKALLDCLGELNDIATGEGLIADSALPRRLTELQAAREKRLIGEAREALDRFGEVKPFWRKRS